jgi:hypothetical protein
LRVRGENHILLRPDDGTPIGYIDVIFLRQAKVKAKSYYPDGFEEGGSAGKRPLCASIDGVTPDPDVQQAQSPLCGTCNHNEWHTDEKGHKSRECSDYKRLAVLILPNQTVRLFGQPLMEPAFLRVPPASLNALAVFGDNMAQQGWPFSSFITRVSFDTTKAHPEFTFKALQALTDAEAATVLGLREEVTSRRITGEDEIVRREHARAALGGPTQSGANQIGQQARVAANLPIAATVPATVGPSSVGTAVPSPPAAATVAAPATVVEALPNPGLFGGVPSPAPVTTKPPTQTVDLPAQGGGAFGLTPTQPEPGPAPQPGAAIGQTADDVGGAAEDADLDARIAAMLQVASA